MLEGNPALANQRQINPVSISIVAAEVTRLIFKTKAGLSLVTSAATGLNSMSTASPKWPAVRVGDGLCIQIASTVMLFNAREAPSLHHFQGGRSQIEK
jgi:hypothetical protein